MGGRLARGLVLLGLVGYWFRTQIALAAFDLFFAKRVKAQLEQSYQPIDRSAPEGGGMAGVAEGREEAAEDGRSRSPCCCSAPTAGDRSGDGPTR